MLFYPYYYSEGAKATPYSSVLSFIPTREGVRYYICLSWSDLPCYVSSTLLLTRPVKWRQEQEIVWRRNETDKEGGNKNNDNQRKHQLEREKVIRSAEEGEEKSVVQLVQSALGTPL